MAMDGKGMRAEILRELTDNILPFWQGRMRDPNGGFYGAADCNGIVDKKAPRAAVINARILWTFWGNKYSRQIFYLPVWERTWWRGVIREARWYLFLEKEPYKYIGHNPLAHTAMFAMFTLFNLGMIITGGALYSEGAGRDSLWAKAFGWVFAIWPNSMDVHTIHHLGMWVIVIFAFIHIYAAVREDIMSRQTMISTMISGERQFRDEREG